MYENFSQLVCKATQELKDKIRDFLLDYSEEYFTALGEPDKRYVEVEDSTYDYLAELKEEYGLSD